jgi:hypothetical protein
MDVEGSKVLAQRLCSRFERGTAVLFASSGDGFAAGEAGTVEELDAGVGLVVVSTAAGRTVSVHPSSVRPASI